MEAYTSPPAGWEGRVAAPCQLAGFAEAMTHMGYRPLYLQEGGQGALALVRGWVPGLRWATARANVIAPEADLGFVERALRLLKRLGVPHVKVGDTMFGLRQAPGASWSVPRTSVVTRHTFVLDLAESQETLFKRQDVSVRTSIRKAEKAGVKIREITSAADLDAYCALAGETSARVRRVTAYTDFPASFFAELYRRLAPTGSARFYLATVDDAVLAGAIFLCSRDRMLYFAGGSTRDRRWTSLQAPTAILWTAIRDAQAAGSSVFDFGGCTPTDDASDPRHGVYAFKKRWGGRLDTFYNLDVVLSPLGHHVQDRILSPLWDRLHPLYFKLLALRKAAP